MFGSNIGLNKGLAEEFQEFVGYVGFVAQNNLRCTLVRTAILLRSRRMD